MKYKLINKQTGEEHLCDKVTIDGFDYYVSDETENRSGKIAYIDNDVYKNELRIVTTAFGKDNLKDCKKVIACNNPNIDIPKVVDEVEMLALLQYPYPLDIKDKNDKIIQTKGEKPFNHAKIEKYRKAFIIGYNKSQSTHPFSLNDVKEIINLAREQYWDIDNKGFSSNTEGDWSFKYSTEDEIIQKYQETKKLTIFYE